MKKFLTLMLLIKLSTGLMFIIGCDEQLEPTDTGKKYPKTRSLDTLKKSNLPRPPGIDTVKLK